MNIKDLLFPEKSYDNIETGNLLIAEPLMKDPYFGRGVILLLDKTEDNGHFGLILNKPTQITLKDLMPDWNAGNKIPVYCGGPVDMERMFLLHTLGNELGATTEILPDLFVGGDLEKVISYIEKDGEVDGKLRFFLGYCGWSAGQLDCEIAGKTWAVNKNVDVNELLLCTGEEYWRKEVSKLGESARSWLIVPPDPSLN